MIGKLVLHVLGIDNTSGPWYGFWSGFGSDLSEFALLGAVGAAYHKHNCIVKGCWRIAKRTVAGTDHVVCHRHHPEDVPTAEDVLADYKSQNNAMEK